MTECERLIANGTFTREFFKPEVRCDFMVDEKRKKIWAVEIDLMLQLDRVCKTHGLKYFLLGGSLLGSIRHKGFIPWDDDVDVGMPREDYEKLMRLGAEFSAPYFLQTPYTDPEYFYAFARLRNSNTLYLSEVFHYQQINHGIPLDIFPFDEHIVDENAEKRFNDIMADIVLNSTYMRMKHPNLDESNRERVRNYPGGDPLARYEKIQRESMRDNGNPAATKVWFPSGGVYGYLKTVWPKNAVSTFTNGSFEGFNFPIPEDYDKILSLVYGDYMLFPPKEKRYPWYGADYFDADIPYSAYLKDEVK